MGRLTWIIHVSPKCHQNCPYKKEAQGDDTHKREGIWRQRQRLEWSGHKQKDAGSHRKLREVKNRFSFTPSGGRTAWWRLDFCSGRLMLNFGAPEPWEKKFLLFETTRVVVIRYSSHRTLIQVQKSLCLYCLSSVAKPMDLFSEKWLQIVKS